MLKKRELDVLDAKFEVHDIIFGTQESMSFSEGIVIVYPSALLKNALAYFNKMYREFCY